MRHAMISTFGRRGREISQDFDSKREKRERTIE
jgi:hypothetical protein